MKRIEIRSPIRSDKVSPRVPAVGIVPHEITDDIELAVTNTRADGSREFPDPFYMDRQRALQYPLRDFNTKGGVKTMHVIPVIDFDVSPDCLTPPNEIIEPKVEPAASYDVGLQAIREAKKILAEAERKLWTGSR